MTNSRRKVLFLQAFRGGLIRTDFKNDPIAALCLSAFFET